MTTVRRIIRRLSDVLARALRREHRLDRLSPEAQQDAITYQQRSGL